MDIPNRRLRQSFHFDASQISFPAVLIFESNVTDNGGMAGRIDCSRGGGIRDVAHGKPNRLLCVFYYNITIQDTFNNAAPGAHGFYPQTHERDIAYCQILKKNIMGAGSDFAANHKTGF